MAAKCIERKGLTKSKVDALVSEIAILKRLVHPNIVLLYDFRWNAQLVFLLMEYCAGGSLDDLLKRRGAVPEDFARMCLRQIGIIIEGSPTKFISLTGAHPSIEYIYGCMRGSYGFSLGEGLRFLWSHSLIHRDLKPANILVKDARRRIPMLKIADFGLAQQIQDDETLKKRFGTPLYMVWIGALSEWILGSPWAHHHTLVAFSWRNTDYSYYRLLRSSPRGRMMPGLTCGLLESSFMVWVIPPPFRSLLYFFHCGLTFLALCGG